MTRFALVSVVVVVVVGCAPQREDEDGDEGEEGTAGEGEGDLDVGDCPDVGAGLVVEDSGEFVAAGVAGDHGDGVVVVMGGAAEVDRASARFVDGAGGGDVLVLRATGSTSSYTEYFDLSSGELAGVTVPPRAVATVRVDDPGVIVDDEGALDEGLACRLRRADAVWLAGGDQSDYLLSWPAALHDALRAAIDPVAGRGVAVGGTSAGAMAVSEFTYDADDGGIDSADAMAAPASTSISRSPFFAPALAGVVVDTHFFARDREGRLLAFAAAAADRFGSAVQGLGIDEETALIIDGDDETVLSDSGGGVYGYVLGGAVDVAGALDVERVVRSARFEGQADAVVDVFSVVDGAIVDP